MHPTRRGHTDLWIGAALFLLVVAVFGRTVGFELVTFGLHDVGQA